MNNLLIFHFSDVLRDDDVDTTIAASEVDIIISSNKDEEDMETSDGEDADTPPKYDPETRDECTTRLLTEVKDKFESMNVGKESALYTTQVEKVRVIVDVQKILQLFQKCQLLVVIFSRFEALRFITSLMRTSSFEVCKPKMGTCSVSTTKNFRILSVKWHCPNTGNCSPV